MLTRRPLPFKKNTQTLRSISWFDGQDSSTFAEDWVVWTFWNHDLNLTDNRKCIRQKVILRISEVFQQFNLNLPISPTEPVYVVHVKEFHVSRRAPTMHMHKIEVMEKGFLDYVYLELDTDLGNYLTPRLRVNPVIVIGGGVMDFHRNVLCLGVPTPGVEPASLCIPNPSHVFHFLNRPNERPVDIFGHLEIPVNSMPPYQFQHFSTNQNTLFRVSRAPTNCTKRGQQLKGKANITKRRWKLFRIDETMTDEVSEQITTGTGSGQEHKEPLSIAPVYFRRRVVPRD